MYLLFDIGGTKMRMAVSEDGVSFGTPLVSPTPDTFDEGVRVLREHADQLLAGHTPEVIAGGIAGVCSKEGALFRSPHLSGWEGNSLSRAFAEMYHDVPTYIENDTALVGLGEATKGAGMGERIVAYVTVSTGVGGALIVDGTIAPRKYGFEPGHQLLDGDETFESRVSGSALQKRYHVAPQEIADPEVWERVALDVARGLHNIVLHWSPDVLVLGGSMILGNPAVSLANIERHLARLLTMFPEPPPLRKATLGDFGGLHGALVLLKSNLDSFGVV